MRSNTGLIVESVIPQVSVSFIDKSIYLRTLGLSLPPGYLRPVNFLRSYLINPDCIL